MCDSRFLSDGNSEECFGRCARILARGFCRDASSAAAVAGPISLTCSGSTVVFVTRGSYSGPPSGVPTHAPHIPSFRPNQDDSRLILSAGYGQSQSKERDYCPIPVKVM